MTNFEFKVRFSPSDLARAVEQFSLVELRQFIAQLVLIVARRQSSTPREVVSEVLPLTVASGVSGLEVDEGQDVRLWQQMTPMQRVTDLRSWVAQERGGPSNLPDEALGRDAIYD